MAALNVGDVLDCARRALAGNSTYLARQLAELARTMLPHALDDDESGQEGRDALAGWRTREPI